MAFTNERHLVLGVALECALVAHSVICSVRSAEGEAKRKTIGLAPLNRAYPRGGR